MTGAWELPDRWGTAGSGAGGRRDRVAAGGVLGWGGRRSFSKPNSFPAKNYLQDENHTLMTQPCDHFEILGLTPPLSLEPMVKTILTFSFSLITLLQIPPPTSLCPLLLDVDLMAQIEVFIVCTEKLVCT